MSIWQEIAGTYSKEWPQPSSLSPATKAKEKAKIPQKIVGKRDVSKSLSNK